MNYYKLRVDLASITPERVVELIQSYADVYMYCIEQGKNNPHIHAYFESDTKGQAIRQSLRNKGLKGNASYSLKNSDEQYPIEYLAYMMKEGEWHESFLPKEILDKAKEYDNAVKESILKKKAERKTILIQVEEYCKDLLQRDFTILDLVQRILRFHKENRKPVRESQIIMYVQTLAVWYESKSIDYIENNILRKIFPPNR